MTPLATSVLVVVMFLAIVGLDVYLAVDRVKSNTYSARSHALGRVFAGWPLLLALAMGVLCGHFFLSDWGDAGRCFWCL